MHNNPFSTGPANIPLQWRHNEHDVYSLFTQPFIRAKIKENTKAPRHWLLYGEFTGDRRIPAQRASDAEDVSIWWRHHAGRDISHQFACA